MSIRKIEYRVSVNEISPASVQRAGLQGEHNATKLIFYISQELAEALGAHGEKVVYRFEAYTGTGEKNSTVPAEIQISEGAVKDFAVKYNLENWLTRAGGNISVYLIFSILSADETLVDLYSYPARLRLEAVPDGKYTDGKNYESVAKLSVAAEDAAERAEAASDEAEAAKEKTLAAERTLTEGTFVFLGGDANGGAKVNLVVDSQLSEYSSNPIANAAAAKKLKEYTNTLDLNNLIKKAVDDAVATAKLATHPIGSLYWSSKPTNPSMIFGGTWEAVKDKFILAAGDKYSAGGTGGAATVKLENAHMPSHSHGIIKAFGTTPLDTIYQPAWAIKLKVDAIDNRKENPATGSTGGIGYTGGNTPHNNMPPYEVYYCWKRIA